MHACRSTLEDPTAVVFGAGGAIGGAVAEAFKREGARVSGAGRTRRNGLATVDALDEKQVDAFVDGVVKEQGRVDICVNAISVGDVQKPLLEISVEEFLQPIVTAMRTHFLTGRAVARHMVKQKGGVILQFGGSGPQTLEGLGGFKVSLDAMEGLRRQWAVELGWHGVRVVTLKTGGIPESITGMDAKVTADITASILKETQLGRVATLADVGSVAAFLASDGARTITSTEVNISCGAMVD